VLGFKGGDIGLGRDLGSLLPDRLVWVAEGENPALDAFPAGARAFSSPVAAFVPDACHEFWKSGVAGDRRGTREILRTRIEPILKVRTVKPGYGISGLKVALEALGRAGGPVRPPGTPVLDEDRPVIAELARKHSEAPRVSRS
jgi:dihydrodipicolinate synthase/N-acetylneuraminate lyase